MEQRIYLIKEGLFNSFISDLITFTFICGSFWFNQQYVGGSYFMNFVIFMMLITFSIDSIWNKTRKFKSNEELIKHLKNNTK